MIISGEAKKILLVEDRPKDMALTLRALERANVANEIVVARDGAEAIDYLIRPDDSDFELPALVLLDLNLPKISGHDVMSRIRTTESTRYVPVVILTSSDDEKDIVLSYANGANSYVRKPVDFNEFMRAVQDVGLYWLITNTAAPND